MRKRKLTSLLFLFLLGVVSPLWAQSNVQYVYDALGRLTSVVDPSGNVATYNYDAVGNLKSITRSTSSPTALAIFGFSPTQGSVGQTVVIQGQNFSTTASSNTVKFNGTTATVTAATANSLTVTVPAGATTGLISVTVGSSSVSSSSSFAVLTSPVITSVSPTLTLNTPTISNFQITGLNLTSATFAFVPTFVPAAVTPSNVVINSNGTSATMTLTLLSSAVGSFTAVATNASGSSSAVPITSNTLTVISADPNADFDGDGLTNIYESAIGSNYANFSTPGDGLPDGWALFYSSVPPLSGSLAGQIGANGLTYLRSFQRGLNPLINNLVPPAVSSVYPANASTNYPTNGVIVVRFTEPLLGGVNLTAAQAAINAALPAQSTFSASNAASAAQVLQAYLQRTCCGTTAVPGVVQVVQNGRSVLGTTLLSNDRLSLTFVPNQFLSASTTFTVSVQNARDVAGNLMAQPPFQSTFTTGLATSFNTRTVLSSNPPSGATNVPTNTPIRVEFSTAVNPATLTPQNFSVLDGFTNQIVTGTIQVDPTLLSASFVPAQPYAEGRSLGVFLTSGITSVLGSPFPAVSFSFTTAFSTDNQGPSLVGTSPSDGATSVPLNALIILEFNEPIDAINALNGLQVQSSGVVVPGGIALSDGNRRLTFTPSTALAPNSTYQVVTTPRLTDFAGNQLLNPDTSTFTTGSASDTTSPTVVSVSPDQHTTGVATNARIQVQFSKRIDPLTLTSSTFYLVPTIVNAQAIMGTIAVTPDGLTATFTPSAALTPETNYTVQVLGSFGVADMEGQTLTDSTTTFTTGLTTVTTGPTVVIVSPPNLSTGVQVNVKVNVVFSAPLAPATTGSGSFQLSAGGTSVPGTVSLSSDRTTLTFVPTGLLAVSTIYTVAVSGATDVAGNVISFTSSFTTGTSGAADTTAITVGSISPATGATGVGVNTPVVLTFNKNIDPSSVNSGTILISTSGGLSPVVAGSFAVSGGVATFTPLTPWLGSTLYHVVIFSGTVRDFAGNTMTSNFSSSFTTAAATNTTSPTVVQVTPNNAITGIGLNAAVVLTFSASLNPNTLNRNSIGILANGNELLFSISQSADNRVVTLSPSGTLPGSSTITVVATSGVQDVYGNALTYFSSKFATAPAFDTTHAAVTSQRPGNGATGVSLNTNVVLYVNEPMNQSTIAGAVHVSQNGIPVSGTVVSTDNGQTIQFTPSSAFQNNALVQVFLDTTAQDVDGNSVTPYQGSFRTAIDTSTVAPTVVSTSPVNAATGISTNLVIDIGFNETLSPTTVNSTTVSLTQGFSGPTVTSTVSLVVGGTVIQIAPNTTLSASTQYYIHLTNGIQGTNGLTSNSSSFFFTTGTGTDIIQPTILSLSPPDGSAGVGNNADVRLLFSKPINPLTVNAGTIQLTGGGTTQIEDVVNFSNNNGTVLLVPHGPLPDNTVMTLAISGITDVAGNAVAARTTHFTTGTGPDLTIPVVVSTNPYSSETGVPLNAPIQARISEPVDPGTVNSSALALVDNTTSQQVAGTYSLSSDGQTISFVPGAPLATSRSYGANFGGGVLADLAGNLLVSIGGAPNFSFVTGTSANTSAPQVVGVSPANGLTGVPINAQVLIQFNEPVDALTVNQVTLTGGGSANVTRSLLNGNQTLVLVPVAPLNTSTTYTVTITGIQDIAGNSLVAPPPTTFTTGVIADLTPPFVATVSPASGATGVLIHSVIQLQFSKRIDPLTVINSTFFVSPSSTGQPIAGAITVSADGLTATFTPTSPLSVSTSYQIQATSGITDLEGQPIVFTASTFTTGTQ